MTDHDDHDDMGTDAPTRVLAAPDRVEMFSPDWNEGPVRRRHRGLVRRAALYACGVDVRKLDFVPEDETTYSVLGTTVLLTTALSFFSGTVATGVILDGTPDFTSGHIFGGLFVACIVFTVDRVLVREPLTHFHFPEKVLAALWNPVADTEWFKAVAENLSRQSLGDRLRQLGTSLAKVLFRLAVAFTLSYFIAEMAALLIFDTEVDERVGILRAQRAQDAEDAIVADYQDRIDRLESRRAARLGESPEKVRERLSASTTELNSCRTELSDLQAQYQSEVAGEVRAGVSRGGEGERTTGLSGVGPAARTLASRIAEKQRQCAAAQAEHDLLLTDLDRASRREAAAAGDKQISEIDADIAALVLKREEAIQLERDRIVDDESGLGLRRTALHDVARDMDPATDEIEEGPTCEAGPALCPVKMWAWPGTPSGNIVGLVRLFFLTIDLLPVLTKLQQSLRRRRPYDALSAALEERSIARAVNTLDEKLVLIGHEIEARASWRKAQRAASAAMYVDESKSAARRRLTDRLRRRARTAPAHSVPVDFTTWRGDLPRHRPRWEREDPPPLADSAQAPPPAKEEE